MSPVAAAFDRRAVPTTDLADRAGGTPGSAGGGGGGGGGGPRIPARSRSGGGEGPSFSPWKPNRPLHEQNRSQHGSGSGGSGGSFHFRETRDDRGEDRMVVHSASLEASAVTCPVTPPGFWGGGSDNDGVDASAGAGKAGRSPRATAGSYNGKGSGKGGGGGSGSGSPSKQKGTGGGSNWFDWLGTSCQSAYDAILLPGVEDEILAATERQQQQQSEKVLAGLIGGGGGGNSPWSVARFAMGGGGADDDAPAPSAASSPAGTASTTSASAASKRQSKYHRSSTAPPAPGLFPNASEDSASDVPSSAAGSTSSAFASTPASASATAASSSSSKKRSSILLRSQTTISDSIGQMGLRFNRSRSESSDAGGGQSARGSTGSQTPSSSAGGLSPSATVADVAVAAARDAEQRRRALSGGGPPSSPPGSIPEASSPESAESGGAAASESTRISSLLPPAPPRIGRSRLKTETWTARHDRLIEDLFDERRRVLKARKAAHEKEHGDGKNKKENKKDGEGGNHHHEHSSRVFKIGNLLPHYHHHHHNHGDGAEGASTRGASTRFGTAAGGQGSGGKKSSPTKAKSNFALASLSSAADNASSADGAASEKGGGGMGILPALPGLPWGSKEPAKAGKGGTGKSRLLKVRLQRMKKRGSKRRGGVKATAFQWRLESAKEVKSAKKKKAKEKEGKASSADFQIASQKFSSWLSAASSTGQQNAKEPPAASSGASTTSSTQSFLRVPNLARFSPSRRKPGEKSSIASSAKGTGVATAGGLGLGDSSSPSRVKFGSGLSGPDLDPGSYLSKKCRLQKDKGKGEVPGTAVSTVGREDALDKLREKVDVIVEVEQSSSAAASKAKLRLKPAVLVDPWVDHASFQGTVETRSVIAVKMGFLSMKYGILLRWDVESGLVSLIVLRKMCPPGFLDGTDGASGADADDDEVDGSQVAAAGDKAKATVEADAAAGAAKAAAPSTPPRTSLMNISPSKKKRAKDPSSSSAIKSKPGLIISRLVDGANAILHGRWDSDAAGGGTEVALLGPPYRVERPDRFHDATLSVTVLRARGLCVGDNKRADWVMNPYIRLSLGGDSHKTGAVKMTCNPTWTKANRNSCRLKSSNNPKEDDSHLKVEVYDWRPFRRDRILGVVFVPVASVEPQKDDGKATSDFRATEVTIPVRMMRNKKGPYGCVTLSLVHRNAYWCWLREELKARGKEMSR